MKHSLQHSKYASQIGESVHLINDDFAAQAGRIVDFIRGKSRGGRSIFVLDQCGYDKVPFQCIRDILTSVPHAEIILTFAADFLIDYLRDKSVNNKLKSIPELNLDSLASKIDKKDPFWRRLVQLELHSEVRNAAGAKFYTPFFIHSTDSHRDLWLVHLSRHHRARDVMVGVHWDLQNSFAHYGKPGLKMLGYSPSEDVVHTQQPYFPGFYFDEKAKALTIEAICEELPSLIFDHTGPIDFMSLYSSISNETPATSEIVKESLIQLARENRVLIKDVTGLKVRRSGIQHDSDVIYIPSQKWLFF